MKKALNIFLVALFFMCALLSLILKEYGGSLGWVIAFFYKTFEILGWYKWVGWKRIAK